MEAQISSPSATAGVLGPLRGVAGTGESEFVAAAARDRTGGSESGADQLDVHSESHRRRPRLAAADRGDAAGALPAGLVDAAVPDDARSQSDRQHQEIRDHVRVIAGLQHALSQSSRPADAVANVRQTADEVLRSALHGRDHSRQQQAQTRPKAEEGRHLPFNLQELRHDIAGHAWSRGEEAVTPGQAGSAGPRVAPGALSAHGRSEPDQ